MKLNKITFKDNDFTMDVLFLKEEKTIYMSISEMCTFFGIARSTLRDHLAKIPSQTATKSAISKTYVADLKRGKNNYYNLDTIIKLSESFNSGRGAKLKAFLDNYLKELDNENEVDDYQNNKQESNVIIYNNGEVTIDVKVSLEEETVWLTQNQIAKLFDTTKQNVSLHINNILNEGEIDIPVSKQKSHIETISVKESFTNLTTSYEKKFI